MSDRLRQNGESDVPVYGGTIEIDSFRDLVREGVGAVAGAVATRAAEAASSALDTLADQAPQRVAELLHTDGDAGDPEGDPRPTVIEP